MKYLFYVCSLILFISCSRKFHGDIRLFGEWKSLTYNLPGIYFDSTHFYIIRTDSTGRNSYQLSYKVKKDIITVSSQNAVFMVCEILKLNADTLVLENGDGVVYYTKQKR